MSIELKRVGKPSGVMEEANLLSGTVVAERTADLEAELNRHRETQARLAKVNRLYSVLSQVNQTILRVDDRQELLDAVCRIAVESGTYRMAWVGLVDERTQRVRPVARWGLDEGYLGAVGVSHRDELRGSGLVGIAICTGQHCVCNDVEHDERMATDRERALSRGYRSAAAFPLLLGSRVVGAFSVKATEAGFFDDAELQLLNELTSELSFALEAIERKGDSRRAEQALRESEARYRRLADNTQDFIFRYALEPRRCYTFVSLSASKLLGYTPEEFYEDPDLGHKLIYPEDRALFEQVARGGQTGQGVLLRWIHKEGRVVWTEDFTIHIYDGEGKLVAVEGIARDVTERKAAEAQLNFQASLLEQVRNAVIVTDLEGWVTWWNKYAETLYQWTAKEAIGRSVTELIVPAENQESGRQILQTVTSLGYWQGEFLVRRKDGTTFPAFVLRTTVKDAQGRVSGHVGISSDITEQKLSQEAARKSSEKLRKAIDGTIQAMAGLSEMRDAYTAGHQKRTARLAAEIAREMGLPEDEVEAIRVAGQIHDIGKISVPAEILSKPGRLTDAEFALIRGHPQSGYEILKGIEFPWPIAGMVLQHHERLDGSGYPFGLAGGQILQGARILAAADAVEAMASHRPYRPALGIEEALTEISQRRNTLYDPEVVDACLRVFRRQEFSLG